MAEGLPNRDKAVGALTAAATVAAGLFHSVLAGWILFAVLALSGFGYLVVDLRGWRKRRRQGPTPKAPQGARESPWEALDPNGRPLVERAEASQQLEGGSMTRWEETRRGQDATVTPKTVEAKAEIPTPTIQTGMTPALSAVMIPAPDNPAAVHFVQFMTANRAEQHENTGQRPKALRFLFPMQATVRESDLPVELPCGSGKLIIKRFTDQGFAFEEQGTAGDEVRAEVYFRLSPSLVVGIEDEEWIPLENSLLVLRVKIKVANRTNHAQRLQGVHFRSEEGVHPPTGDELLVAEFETIQARSYPLPGVVDPNDSVSGWKVCAFRSQPTGGTPEYEIGVEDALGDVYWEKVAKRARKGLDLND